MRSVKTVPCRTQEWDFCYNPYSVVNTLIVYYSKYEFLSCPGRQIQCADGPVRIFNSVNTD